ncbi:MAG: ATP-binding cassette domain-containing protein [Megasphaera sp.]|jgi:ABC-2 type transport system ATP-binding protein|nr:ATP-binding cassette domain-containing protein [Megasphaera sp.]MCI1247695.1 ATP-binding cassette domain-containing protein [Megasphaera sp.]
MTEQKIIRAVNLCKTFHDVVTGSPVEALHQINMEIEPGQLTALIGPDGAGKTTFLRLLCGLMSPTAGTLSVLGMDVTRHPQAIQDQLSYMPQKFGLYEDLSVQENLRLYADLHGVPAAMRQARFDRLLRITGLSSFTNRPAGKLSGGMKQKLGLACTLVRSPKLLLLDEPTVGVDPLSRRELWAILQELTAEEHISVFVSTAYMDEAALCQQVYILHQGHLLDKGSPAELLHASDGCTFMLRPPAGVPARILQAALLDDAEHVVDAVPASGEVRFSVTSPTVLSGLNAYRYFDTLHPRPIPAVLEDSFMKLLRAVSHEPRDTHGFELDYGAGTAISDKIEIEVRDLVRKFGNFTAVDNTSFQVRRGEIFGLLGPNGAGKSTTFRMLCGLLPATSGFLSVAGVNLRTARAQARANVGYVAQKFSLYGTLSVKENLEFFGGAYGLTRQQIRTRMAELLQQFGLTDQVLQPAGTLPGGYKQRLSMAAALMHRPRILFLDEPTSGIDPLARRTFWRQITALAATGTTIIITTHFMEEAEYCDRIMIQDQGRMLAIGTPAEIRRSGSSRTMNEAFIAIVEQARADKEANAS